MNAPVRRRTALEDRYWHGMLCHDTFDAIIERISQILDGKFYTWVDGNSYSETDHKFSSISVRVAERLRDPVRINKGDSYWSASFADTSHVWGLHTKVQTESDARHGSIHDQVAVTFNAEWTVSGGAQSVTIDHYAPAGYRLQWIIAVEDHTDWSA